MQNYPFRAENIDLSIYVYSKKRKQFDVGQLSSLKVIKGKIIYHYRDSEYTVEVLKTEDYEEAKKIVFSKDKNEKISL